MNPLIKAVEELRDQVFKARRHGDTEMARAQRLLSEVRDIIRRSESPLAKTVASLKAHGVPVIAVNEGDDLIDGEIVINDTVSVQVGDFDLGVVVQDGDSFRMFPPRPWRYDTIAMILADLRTVNVEVCR